MRSPLKFLLDAAEEYEIDLTTSEDELIKEGIMTRDGIVDNVKLYNFLEAKYFKALREQTKESSSPQQDDLSSSEKISSPVVNKPTENPFDKYDINSKFYNDKKYEKNTPYGLRGRRQFICWDWKWTENKKDPSQSKWTKVPKNPKTGGNAMSNERSTWSEFETACKAVDKYGFAGIGVMFADGLIGIDLDDVIVDGKLNDKAKEIIQTVESYTELSPTETGVHILAFADIPESVKTDVDGNSFEIYGWGRFFTLSGKLIPEMWYKIRKKAETNPAVNAVYEKFFKRSEQPKTINKYTTNKLNLEYNTGEIGTQLLFDEDIYEKCIKQFERRKIHPNEPNKFKEIYDYGNWEDYYPSQNDADVGLCGLLTFYSDSPEQVNRMFENSALYRDKWERRWGDSTYGRRTIQLAFERCTSRYGGNKKVSIIGGEENG